MANAILQIRIVDRIKDVDRLPHPLPEAWLDKIVMPLQKDGTGTSSAWTRSDGMLAWVRDRTDPPTQSNNTCALSFVHMRCTELLLGLIRTNVKIFVRTSQHLVLKEKRRG